MRVPGFVGGSFEPLARVVAGERTMNFYPEIVQSESAKAKATLYPCPGLPDFATPTDSPGRGIFAEESGRCFAVFGVTVYELDSAGVPTSRGTVAVDAKPATFATNGSGQMILTSGTKGYLYTLATNALTNPVNNVTMCGQIDNFFVALDGVTGTMKISNSANGAVWDPTQIARRSAAADPWIAMIVSRREMFLFGNKTGEVWFNAGNSPFPFAQRAGAFFEVGIEADFSLAPFGDTLAWLGRSSKGSARVYWMNGYTPNPISDFALEAKIQGYKDAGTIADAIGWSYDRLGHSFYVLEFPTAQHTWVYDATTSAWHERGRWDSLSNNFVPYRPRFHAEIFRKDLVCDGQTGKIYNFSETVYTDVGGGVLRRLRRCRLPQNENQRVFVDYLELECQRGVGLVAGQGSDPLMMLRVSFDGGETWGNERTRSLGKIGKHSQRVRWNRCGSGRDPMVELVSSDPVPVRLFDLYAGLS